MTDAQPTFEEAIARLEKIVEHLQRDDVPLEEALTLFKEGSDLTAQCDSLLSSAELRVQQLTSAVHERFASYQPGPSLEADDETYPPEDNQ